MISGTVFDIQRFSISDGPGVRTSVFLKGCPMRCAWCHNPESQKVKREIRFIADKCVCCGMCANACKTGSHEIDLIRGHVYNRASCSNCAECVDLCEAKALQFVGRNMTSEQVMSEVVKDAELYAFSGGGMTLTGGEPLMQAEFSLEILKAAKAAGISTVVETAGFAKWDTLGALSEYTDIWLYDIKGFDSRNHEINTGVGNETILKNLRLLSVLARIFVRMPLIAGVNDSIDEAERTAAFLAPLSGVEQIELLPYHHFGESKYALVGRAAVCFEAPDQQRMHTIAQIYSSAGKRVITHAS